MSKKNQRRTQRARAADGQPKVRQTLCVNLRNRRVELGLSQRVLGEAIGVVQQWITQLEAPDGNEVPSLYQLEDLARALNCSPHDLLIPGRFNAGIDAQDDMRLYQHRTR